MSASGPRFDSPMGCLRVRPFKRLHACIDGSNLQCDRRHEGSRKSGILIIPGPVAGLRKHPHGRVDQLEDRYLGMVEAPSSNLGTSTPLPLFNTDGVDRMPKPIHRSPPRFLARRSTTHDSQRVRWTWAKWTILPLRHQREKTAGPSLLTGGAVK